MTFPRLTRVRDREGKQGTLLCYLAHAPTVAKVQLDENGQAITLFEHSKLERL